MGEACSTYETDNKCKTILNGIDCLEDVDMDLRKLFK
jgi:hypothetical protein